jgi:hypothetical protein
LLIAFHAASRSFADGEAVWETVRASAVQDFPAPAADRDPSISGGDSMSDPEADTTPLIPLPVSKELRTLAHDLSNSIETIMQATYLLNQSKVDESDRKWLDLIDQATRDAAKINRQIREVLRSHSQPSS